MAILSLGTRLGECLKAADELAARGLSATVADARFAKPLDEELLKRLATNHSVLITVEEGAAGGFAAHVMQNLAQAGLLDNGLKVRPMVLPDRFIDHDSPANQLDQAGLTARHIVINTLWALGIEEHRRARQGLRNDPLSALQGGERVASPGEPGEVGAVHPPPHPPDAARRVPPSPPQAAERGR